MSISIASLCEWFATKLALEWHLVLVDSQMVSQVAKFWELQWATLAHEHLVQSLRYRIEFVNEPIFSHIFDLFVSFASLIGHVKLVE